MYFVNSDHRKEFVRLQLMKTEANTSFDYCDYCYAYYILTSDVYLRSFLKMFLDKNNGDIEWALILDTNQLAEDYRQIVAFAHQLFSNAWKNVNFNFVRLLDDVSDKPQLLKVIQEACRLYSQKLFIRNIY